MRSVKVVLLASLLSGAGSASLTAFAHQQPVARSPTVSSVLQAKTPILTFPEHDLDYLVTFAMAYANAKAASLEAIDPASAKEWHDYFITSVGANTVPPGVLAFGHKLKAIGKAATTNPNIVLANITGEQVMDVVYKNHHDHLKQSALP